MEEDECPSPDRVLSVIAAAGDVEMAERDVPVFGRLKPGLSRRLFTLLEAGDARSRKRPRAA